MYAAVLTTRTGRFSLETQFFRGKTDMHKWSSKQRDISFDETSRDFFRSGSKFFIEVSPQNVSTKTQIWIFGHNNRSFSCHSSRNQYSFSQNPLSVLQWAYRKQFSQWWPPRFLSLYEKLIEVTYLLIWTFSKQHSHQKPKFHTPGSNFLYTFDQKVTPNT